MKKSLLSVLLSCTLSMGFAQQFAIDTVYFGFDSYNLKEDYATILDSLVGVFASYPSYYVEIFGHTDSIGSEAYNLELSELRARAVSLYLVEQGVSLDRIAYEGLGTRKPVGDNLSYAGRRQNRRADIAVIYSDVVDIPIVDTGDGQEEPIEVINPASITDTILCDYNPFLIDPQHRTVVITPAKSKLVIEPNTFNTPATEVMIEVDELFTRKEMIENKITTISKGGPLEAAGIISFSATANGRAVKLNPVPFTVTLPVTRRDAEMDVYLGSGGGRGGSRRRRRGEQPDGNVPAINPVRSWNPVAESGIQFKGRERSYTFKVNSIGRYAVARPLYYSQNTDRQDKGIDIFVKFKGKRYDKNTNAMVLGEVVKTYIPLVKKDKRNYQASKVKFIDDRTPMMVVGIQYDDRGNPWLAKRSFTAGSLLRKSRKKRGLPYIKMKIRFNKLTKERLNELLTELNAGKV